MTYLVPNIFVKVLVCGNIKADTAGLEPLSLDLEIRVWHGRDDDVRHGQTLPKSEIARVDDVARVVALCGH